MKQFENEMKYVMLSQEQIRTKVEELAETLTKEYEGKRPILVCILKGSVIFYADICRLIDCDMQMDFMVASSYGSGAVFSGKVDIKKDLDNDIKGRHVLLVEDIIDSGNTLYNLKNELIKREPASVKIVTLLNKQERREADISADYCGFDIPNEFVVGYGLDYNEKYRNMPYIGVLKPEIYE